MPRPYTSRKRSYRFRRKAPWYRRKYSASEVAYKAFQGVKYLKGLVNSEMHHKDTTISLSTQNLITHITSIAQGDNDFNRTGNSLLLRNIYIRGTMEIDPAVTSNTRISLVLVKDLQQVSDSSPTLANIFNTPTDPNSLLSLSTSGRFKILWRKNYVLTPSTASRPAIDINKYWKIYDHVRFNGTAATDIQKNGYYFCILTSESVNFPQIDCTARVGFHDN